MAELGRGRAFQNDQGLAGNLNGRALAGKGVAYTQRKVIRKGALLQRIFQAGIAHNGRIGQGEK